MSKQEYEHQIKPTFGFSFIMCIGNYGGFHIAAKKARYFRICLGWIAFTFYLTDFEAEVTNALLRNKIDVNHNSHTNVINNIQNIKTQP